MKLRILLLLGGFLGTLLGGTSLLVLLAQEEEPVNYASAAAGAVVEGPQNASGSQGRASAVNDGEVLDYSPNSGYAWAYLDTPLTVTLAEAQQINKIEVLFLDLDARTYQYRLEVSADGQAFETIADCTGEPRRSWQTHVFAARPVKIIRLTVTGTSVEAGSYHIVELAAWNQAPPEEPSPLRRKFDRRADFLAQQRQARAKTIGLEEVVAAAFGKEEVMERARALDEAADLKLDLDQDGDPDILVWREGQTLLAGWDEDDDMAPHDVRPDEDSDCWVADYHGDGEIDRAIDYLDQDGDGDADASVLYLLTPNVWSRRDMTCVVIGDLDDDNRMWFLRNYEYDQGTCQWQCDFSGNEFFSMGHYDETQGRWVSWLENPFCFYDLDGNGDSEVVIRFSGNDLTLRSLRYSFDLDNDATSDSPDYDFSLTALGNVQAPDELATTFPLRGGGKLTFVAWEHGREVAEWAPWNRALLCWDEDDNNVNPYGGERVHERWEGVIAHGSEHFPQEGGPSCGPFNKRYEVDNDFSGGLRLYSSGIDRRIHLCGAEFGWLDADYNYDGKVDLRFRYEDTDGNGFFDTWRIDSDADGRWDWTATMPDEQVQMIPWNYDEMHRLFADGLSAAQLEQERLLRILKERTGGQESDVERYWREGLPGFYASEKVRNSPEGQRFYRDLILARRAREVAPFPLGPGPAGPPPTVTLKLTNPLPLDRPAEPVVIPLTELPEVRVPPGQPFAVRDGEKLLPAQADDLDGDGGSDELVFLIDLAAHETRTVTLLPQPPHPPAVEKKTATNLYMGASLGWESNLIAYRTYYGKIDVFGKKGSFLKLRELKGAYHQEADWGMDILHLGPSAGVGGLYLWQEGRAIPAMNEEGQPENVKIAKRVLVDGPLRSIVEVELTGLQTLRGPFNLTRRFTIYAEGQHTEERLTLVGGEGGALLYSPGLIQIEGEQWGQGASASGNGAAGKGLTYLWNWGKQSHPDVADAGEIGLALLVPTEALVDVATTGPDRVLRCRIRSGVPQRHYLAACWAKGRRYPTAEAWRNYIAALAQRLAVPVEWERVK